VEALGQTKSSLGVLRLEAEPPELAPSPRLAQADGLLAPAREAGLDVSLRTEGRERELPDTVEMCGYRVIQESLTNVVRHARATTVRIIVAYEHESLVVTIEDDGSSSDDGPVRTGAGIEGMRERVGLIGGSLDAGQRATGGWMVRAMLPAGDRS
ncbi:MAG: sensor histidine kinase, partial [Actinomycetota bacterium]|nr:sensor histidine kinase [Actinomycetota bacterium]